MPGVNVHATSALTDLQPLTCYVYSSKMMQTKSVQCAFLLDAICAAIDHLVLLSFDAATCINLQSWGMPTASTLDYYGCRFHSVPVVRSDPLAFLKIHASPSVP